MSYTARDDLDDLLYGLAMALRGMAQGQPSGDWWRLAELARRALLNAR
jgi:hypothetical protein